MPRRPALKPVLLALAMPLAAAAAAAQGLTEPVVLAPFQPTEALCASPGDRTGEIVFARDNARDFMSGVASGLTLAARDRGLGFREVDAANDPGQQAAQVQRLAAESVGAVVAAPVDARALAPDLQRLLEAGGLRGHRGPAACDDDTERAAVPDRPRAGRGGGRPHPRRAGRRGPCRAADPRQPRIPGTALCGHARRAARGAGRRGRGRHLAAHRGQRGRLPDHDHDPAGRARHRRRARRRHRWCWAPSPRCGTRAPRVPTSSSAASTASPRRSPSFGRPTAPSRSR
jgi:hypothetical protein